MTSGTCFLHLKFLILYIILYLLDKHKTAPEVLGCAHLKIGTLRDVTAIAGYVQGQSGRRYAVAAIINHPNAPAARPALRQLVAWAARD